MSTLSPNFNLVIATTSDQVNVVTQVAGNFSTLDALFAIVHTGTGQLKGSLFLATPSISSPTITGSMSGIFSITASTGQFNTITATGGILTLNTLNIGTYALPSTVGATGALLTVVTGNAVFVAPSGGTGANTGLSNLAAVAINTSLNTFTAGFVTVDRVIASSGAITGLTSLQATVGTFAGLLTALGTITANVVNCTGGMGTFSNITIGTYALPSVLGSTGQILRVASSTLGFTSPVMTTPVAFTLQAASAQSLGSTIGTTGVNFTNVVYDPGSYITTGMFTAPTSGVYNFSLILPTSGNGGVSIAYAGIAINSTAYTFVSMSSSTVGIALGSITRTMGSGQSAFAFIGVATTGATVSALQDTNGLTRSIFSGFRLFEF